MRVLQVKRRADERTRTAFLLIMSALLAIWVQPKGLLAELRPYLLTQTRKPRRMEGWLSLLLTYVETHAYLPTIL